MHEDSVLLNSEFILGGEVKMEVVKVTDIPGIKIGNAQDLEAGTGCTVILCEQGLLPVLMSGRVTGDTQKQIF